MRRLVLKHLDGHYEINGLVPENMDLSDLLQIAGDPTLRMKLVRAEPGFVMYAEIDPKDRPQVHGVRGNDEQAVPIPPTD